MDVGCLKLRRKTPGPAAATHAAARHSHFPSNFRPRSKFGLIGVSKLKLIFSMPFAENLPAFHGA